MFDQAKKELIVGKKKFTFFSIRITEEQKLKKLPFSLRILLENLIRHYDGEVVNEENIKAILERKKGEEIPFFPERVILQDFTGVPLITDLAVMRDVAKKLGYDPKIINPIKRCDLVIDHSVQVDFYGSDLALELNIQKEFERNRERYIFLKWAQKAFKNMRVIPPGAGIIHQVNLEFLADVVRVEKIKGLGNVLYPDTLLGTDSHTTMINALGVLGWGVGGIEAEAVMLGEPYYITVPEVIGVKLSGKPKPEITATDIVLTITQVLRKKGVVDKFVEFFGDGVKNLPTQDRATISNMCPEYGARCSFFPPDEKTIEYLVMTARPKEHVKIVETYLKENLMFQDYSSEPEFDDVVEINLEEIEPSVAGPSRPHDRIPLSRIKEKFYSYLGREPKGVEIELDGGVKAKVGDGTIIISAITSCTNTSNPELMIGAGILAKKAVERGLRVPPWVKTSNAPGSEVVSYYLEKSGLLPYLKALGFHITGYGCTVCIGNSGPINSKIESAIKENGLTCVAVLSGNRNFEGRIHLSARANFLMSPPLVVAFAIAGKIIDPYNEPLGYDPSGLPVYLKDIWPSKEEIEEVVKIISPKMFKEKYSKVFEGSKEWKELPSCEGDTFPWDENSTYIKPPPFFDGFTTEPPELQDIKDAHILLYLGDTITTDHISPAGSIPRNSPAGQYLISKGVKPEDFNSYGARRGNWEVMVRGTFANTRIKNLIFRGEKEGGYTIFFPEMKETNVFEASELYKEYGIPLIVVAGKEYGAGSSRDWAAKGTYLLGVKAVIAESFETIHRSNLIGMGVVPLRLKGTNAKELGITGKEKFFIPLKDLAPKKEIEVKMIRENGEEKTFKVIAEINTKVELEYIKHGGILPYVLRKILTRQRRKKREKR
jgi:aconitate hydratase